MFVYTADFTLAVLVWQLEAIPSHNLQEPAQVYLPWHPNCLLSSTVKKPVQERNTFTSIHWESDGSVCKKQMSFVNQYFSGIGAGIYSITSLSTQRKDLPVGDFYLGLDRRLGDLWGVFPPTQNLRQHIIKGNNLGLEWIPITDRDQDFIPSWHCRVFRAVPADFSSWQPPGKI